MNRNINDVPVLNPDDDVLKYSFPSAETDNTSGNVPDYVDSECENEIICDFDLFRKSDSYK